MEPEITYYVWERNDGYVNVTAWLPSDWVDEEGNSVTFKLIMKTDSWEEAYFLASQANGIEA